MGAETYTQREDFFFPYLHPGARACQRLHPLASSSETPLIDCVFLFRPCFSTLCPNLTAWFSSRGLLPVTHLLYPRTLIVLSSSCLLIKVWQLAKAHRVIRNEPKIHVTCYITFSAFLCIVVNVKAIIKHFFPISLVFLELYAFFVVTKLNLNEVQDQNIWENLWDTNSSIMVY